MIRMKSKDFEEMYKRHLHFLAQDIEGWEEMRGDFTGCDLSKYELAGMNFAKAIMVNCDFTDADIRACNFTEADLSGARFIRTKMQSCNFEGTRFIHCAFKNSPMNKSVFDTARLSYCYIYGCDMKGVSFFETRMNNNLFESITFNSSSFIRTKFRKSNTFCGCIMDYLTMDEIEGFETLIIDGCFFDDEYEPENGLRALRFLCKKEYAQFRWNKLKGRVKEQVNKIGKAPEVKLLKEGNNNE